MRALVLCIFGPLVASSALSLDPAKHVSQCDHTAWRAKDGSIPESGNAIAHIADGYIWIATDSGLLQFDSVKFVPFAPSLGEPIPNPGVISLFADRDGSLWIGTKDNLEHWREVAHSAWSADSELDFRVQPKFYQSAWFRLLCVMAGLCTVMLLVRWRTGAVRRNLRAGWQARMDERKRIARDLHDTLFQNVQCLFLAIDNSTNTLPDEHPTRLALKRLLERSDEVMSESRKRVLDLRSEALNRDSIANALSQVGNELSKVYSPAPAFGVEEVGTPERLHPFVFDEVFRICREALFNAFRHSRARHIEVEILLERRALSIRIRDDGVGVDERVLSDGKPGHFGLKGMQERARTIGAQLIIRSKPHAGTEIDLSIPKIATVRSPPKPR